MRILAPNITYIIPVSKQTKMHFLSDRPYMLPLRCNLLGNFHESHDRSRGFLYRNGRMFCSKTNIAVQLTDVTSGDGGFACLPGSHRANFPCPNDIQLYHTHQVRFIQLPAKAGRFHPFCRMSDARYPTLNRQTPAPFGHHPLHPRHHGRVTNGHLHAPPI